MTKLLTCSFCGKRQDEVKKLIAGPEEIYICDECVSLCYEIVSGEEVESGDKQVFNTDNNIPSPRRIKEFLDQYIIGQDYAKTVVSVAVSNHYKRINNPVVDDVELEKSNILLLGPTGVGKTLMAQTIARMLDVPIAITDATTLTESGYVGDDVESIIVRLLQVANYDINKAQKGIIYIDEIDKKGRKGDNASITRDVSGEGVQQALLKIIEGTEIRVPPQGGRKHPAQEMISINTKDILFIVGGAFVGLEDVVHERLTKDHSGVGFGATIKQRKKQEISDLLKKVEPEDLVKFGLIPELIGRLPVIAPLEDLTVDQLVEVLTQPKNAIVKQFVKLFKLENVELDFKQDALEEIARIANERKTGARGLRSVIEQKLIKVQYDLPDLRSEGVSKIVINKNVITGDAEPEIIKESLNEEEGSNA